MTDDALRPALALLLGLAMGFLVWVGLCGYRA
jgi:hypothetical protein